MMTSRPAESENAACYARYVALVPELDILTVLQRQLPEVATYTGVVSPEREKFRYAPEKRRSTQECTASIGVSSSGGRSGASQCTLNTLARGILEWCGRPLSAPREILEACLGKCTAWRWVNARTPGPIR